jgi:beta-phosphoglucomutase
MGSLDLILASAARQYTPEEKLALADTKNRHYQELISTMSADDLLPGAVAALDAVRAAGLRIGLASVSKNAFTVLGRLGITDKFDYVVDAATIARGKPDPEIFLRAASELGVAPADCLAWKTQWPRGGHQGRRHVRAGDRTLLRADGSGRGDNKPKEFNLAAY